MAMICIKGTKECNGCMDCIITEIEVPQCAGCGEQLSPDNIFWDEGEYFCKDCLIDNHFCYDYEFGDNY